MKRILLLIGVLCTFWGLSAQQNNMAGYEYWIDSNYGNRQSQSISPTKTFKWQATISGENLSPGIHTFNARFRDQKGNWSPTIETYFYKPDNPTSNTLTAYEYWVDNAPRITQSGSSTKQYVLLQTIALDTLTAGIHNINFRFKDSQGRWSSTVSSYFYKMSKPKDNNLITFEYWVNDLYGERQTGSINRLQSFVLLDSLDIRKATKATNYIRFRFKDSFGQWSSVFSQDFYRPVEPDFTSIVGLSEVTFTNTSKYADTYEWDFGDSTAVSTQVNPIHTYAEPGAYKVKLIARNKEFTDSLTQYMEIEGIRKITNNKGGNGGYSSFDIYGGGLDEKTVVKLVKGSETISTHTVYRREQGIICATFDLTNKTIGIYDIVVTINGKNYTITNGFTIEEANYPEAWTKLEGNTVFIPGRWQTYTVNYGNSGNNDIYGLPINIIFSNNSDCEFAFDLIDGIGGNVLDIYNPDSYVTLTSITSELFGGRSIEEVYNLITNPSDIISLNTEAFDGKMYSVLIPHIPANTNSSFSFRLKVNTSSVTKMYVNTGEILNDVFFNTQEGNIESNEIFGYKLTDTFNIKKEEINEIIKREINKSFTNQQTTSKKEFVNFVTLINTSDCFLSTNNLRSSRRVLAGPTSTCDVNYKRIEDIEELLQPNGCGAANDEKSLFIYNLWFKEACYQHDIGYATCGASKVEVDNKFAKDMCQACKINASVFTMGICLEAANTYYKSVVKYGKKAFDNAQRLACERDALKEKQVLPCPESTPMTPQVSVDPNEIIGPFGYGEKNYIAKRNSLYYNLFFENDAHQATAPAQEIFLTDTLDLTKFNPEQFSFGTFTFRDITVEAIPGLTEFSKDVDMRPKGENIIVRVSAVFDKVKGIINWHLIALDPTTMDLTESPYLGILYPNTTPPIGEGNVTYSSGLRSDVGDGAVIENQGHIIFDLNEAIATNVYVNTIDAASPISRMDAAYNIEKDSIIVLSWLGTDTGSGIAHYTVYVSENDGDYFPWLLQTGETSGKFEGKQGNTYKFFVVATDNVGNSESFKTNAELTVFVEPTSLKTPPNDKIDLRVIPNPVENTAVIKFYLQQAGNVLLYIHNIAGQKIMELYNNQAEAGLNQIPFDAAKLDAGIYFITLQSIDSIETIKVVIK